MKRNLYFVVIILIGIIAPKFASAQSGNDKVPSGTSPVEFIKGPHGGRVIGEGNIRFELIDNASTVSFYPVNNTGHTIVAVPTVATCTIVYAELSQHYQVTNVQLTNGCFTINPPRDYPVYIYAIETTFNGNQIDAKYALPIKTK